ncbi:uncharacterized protein [Parasteatoda tepidariorum]|uniref:uncharacterized protein n=1 Tax=Parasteatoda tepidariorum TaxID=114398 RepID=UPI001C71E7C9|nr:uncharacterized protein LOC107439965 [Parasteatoda tepidariorum]
MISSYLCRTLKNPRKQFQKLENNTLKICWNRLQNYKIFPSVKEIRAIGKAYATLIEANLVKNRLTYADAIAQEALTILDFRNDPDCSILLHSLLIDLHLFSNRSDECWKYLNMLSSLLDDDRNYDIFAQYYCGLSAAILMDNTVGNEGNLRIEKDIKKCNEFASKWNMNITQTMPKDLAFFVSAKMSVWCHKGADIFNWQETKTVFNRCYEMTFNLFKDQTENSYWSIGGSLAYFKLRLVSGGSEDIKENLNFVTEQLKIIKEEIMLHFPVYKEEYNQLLNDVKTFETVHLDSSSL